MDTENVLPTAQPKMISVFELSEYIIDFQVIQLATKPWAFALHIFPQSETGLIEDGDIVEGMGVVQKIHGINAVVMYGRDTFSEWEYAAESAIDVIESLGFGVDEVKQHEFKILFWDDTVGRHVQKTGIFEDNEVKLGKRI